MRGPLIALICFCLAQKANAETVLAAAEEQQQEQLGWIRPEVIYSRIHKAETVQSEIDGLSFSIFERVSGHRGYFYRNNEEYNRRLRQEPAEENDFRGSRRRLPLRSPSSTNSFDVYAIICVSVSIALVLGVLCANHKIQRTRFPNRQCVLFAAASIFLAIQAARMLQVNRFIAAIDFTTIMSGNATTVSAVENKTTMSPSNSLLDGAAESPKKQLPLIAIVTCSKSKNGKEEWTSVNSTSLYNLLIPSLEKTITSKEWEKFTFEIIIGFDTGDIFWERAENRQALMQATKIPISFLSIPKKPDRPHQIPFNPLLRATYEYGADYMARVNDDTEFLTKGWATLAVHRLAEYEPPNVGVVGPLCRQGATDIMTHDLVHRTHLDIFKDYYPDEFDNWWVDDWISEVYGRERTTKITRWEVFHHTGKHGTRYKVNFEQKNHLSTTLNRGSKQIQEYLSSNQSKYDNGAPRVLGTHRIAAVFGPMQSYHKASSSSNPNENSFSTG